LPRSVVDYRGHFGLDIWFICYSYTQLVSTSNYNGLTELHTANIAVPTAHTTSCFHSLTFKWFLNCDWLFSSQTPVHNWLCRPSCLPYNSRARPARATPFILIC
jgi:hypothetical protein